MRLSVVMPVYNERESILKVIDRVLKEEMVHEVIVVDDGSSDGTRELLLRSALDSRVKVLLHDKNMGKGAALRTGFQMASGDVTVVQDADHEYDPAEYKALMAPIERGDADAVYGSRLSGGRPQRAYLFWHKLGNNFITLFANLLYNTTLSDIETGYKMIRTSLLKEISLRSNGFDIEPEVTAKMLKKRARVYEVPISYYGRTYSEGKKIFWYHGLEAIWTLVKYRFVD
ncbi:glycosyltransferase family 2 protein [Omnitrophica bacterium]|nr:glycosyltransferase family 2 protein [Candidatus Omnitrophota bacterium]